MNITTGTGDRSNSQSDSPDFVLLWMQKHASPNLVHSEGFMFEREMGRCIFIPPILQER